MRVYVSLIYVYVCVLLWIIVQAFYTRSVQFLNFLFIFTLYFLFKHEKIIEIKREIIFFYPTISVSEPWELGHPSEIKRNWTLKKRNKKFHIYKYRFENLCHIYYALLMKNPENVRKSILNGGAVANAEFKFGAKIFSGKKM